MSTFSNVESLLLVAIETETTLAPCGAGDRHAGVTADSDHNLLARTREGDETAFAEIVTRYRTPLVNYVNRILGDYDAAVDIAQETFIRLYQARDRYHTGYAFSTYIYRIATNLAISELRRRKRRRLISLTGFFGSTEENRADAVFDLPDGAPLADSALVEGERRAAVHRAVASLPTKYRVPVVLRDIEGSSYEEIAHMLDTSVGTIKSRISRARTLLRSKLAGYL